MTDLQRASSSPAELLICQTLVEMLHEKPLMDITVKELSARAHVARSTFYAHYRNVDDVLEQVEDALITDIICLNEPVSDPARTEADDMDFFRSTLDYLDEHREVMGVLLVERPDARFIEAWKDGIKGHLRARYPMRAGTENGELAMEIAASALVAACTYELKSGDSFDRDFACAIVVHVLQMLKGLP